MPRRLWISAWRFCSAVSFGVGAGEVAFFGGQLARQRFVLLIEGCQQLQRCVLELRCMALVSA